MCLGKQRYSRASVFEIARNSVTEVCLRHGRHEPKSSLSLSKASLGFQENFFEEMCFFPSVKKKNILLIKQVFCDYSVSRTEGEACRKDMFKCLGRGMLCDIQGVCSGAADTEPWWS